jgi:hypothetical protein
MRSVTSVSAAVQNALPVVAEKANATAQAAVAKAAASKSAAEVAPANDAASIKVEAAKAEASAQGESEEIKVEAKLADKAVDAAREAADKLADELKRAKLHLSDAAEAPAASSTPAAPSAPTSAPAVNPVAAPANPAPTQPVPAPGNNTPVNTAPAATSSVAVSTKAAKVAQPAASPRDPEARIQNLLDRFDRLASRLEKALANRDEAAQGARAQGFRMADRGLARLLVGRQLLEKSASLQSSFAVQVADRLFTLAAVIKHRNDSLDSLLNAVSPAKSSGGYRNDYYAAREVAGLMLDLSA